MVSSRAIQVKRFENIMLNCERLSTHLNGVYIVGDNHELSFLLLDEGGHSVDAVSHHGGSLAGGVLLACRLTQLSTVEIMRNVIEKH